MSYKVPNIPLITSPVGVDKAIQEIQVLLANNLLWLDRSFGRANTGSKKVQGRDFYYPEVYDGSAEYLDVSPNDNLIAQSFFIVDDPEKINSFIPYQTTGLFQFNVSIIFWYNLDEVKRSQSYSYNHRFTEELKKQILEVLMLNQSNFIPDSMSESVEEIYKGYSIDNVASQTLKHPFAGLRINGILSFEDECN